MSLLEVLTRDRLAAFKARNKVKATLLATVIAEAKTAVRKQANRDPGDEEILAIIRKFIKNNKDTMAAAPAETVAKLEAENELLDGYLPRMLDDQQLEALVQPLVEALPEKSPRAMGPIMGRLKGRADVDMKKASAIVKRLLAS
jgi:uncharacterized protein YqeY